jgi:hypothetical protein
MGGAGDSLNQKSNLNNHQSIVLKRRFDLRLMNDDC